MRTLFTDPQHHEPLIVWAHVVWAAFPDASQGLLTVILAKWPGGSTAAGGFIAAAVLGLLTSVAIGLGFYAMTTLPTSAMSFIDPLISAAVFGIIGAAIGFTLGKGDPSPA